MPVHVHVNCAMTLDGAVGGPGRTPLKISDAVDVRRVHELRAAVDAVLVGVGTVVADDPKLTVKWDLLGRTGTNPLRVVLDRRLRAPTASVVFDGAAPTVSFAAPDAIAPDARTVERVPMRGDALDLRAILARLEGRGVRRLLVEGGPLTLARFFREDLVDVFTLYIAPRAVGDASAPRLVEKGHEFRPQLRITKAQPQGEGILVTWERR